MTLLQQNKTTLDVVIDAFKDYLIEEDKSPLTITSYLNDLKAFVKWMNDRIHDTHQGGNGGSEIPQKVYEKFTHNFSKPLVNKRQQDETYKNQNETISQLTNQIPLTLAVTQSKEYVQELKQSINYEASTIIRRIITLKRFFGFLVDYNYINKNPLTKIKSPKIQGGGQNSVKWLEEFEVKKIIETISNMPKTINKNKTRNKAVILILVNCGVRVHELTELRIKDVDFERNEVKVRHGKGNKFHIVPLTKSTKAVLLEWLNYRKEEEIVLDTDFLINSKRSKQLTDRGVQHLTKRLSELSGIKFSPHTLRHTYGKRLTDEYGIRVAQKLLGHEDINTTKIYTQPSREELKHYAGKVEFNSES